MAGPDRFAGFVPSCFFVYVSSPVLFAGAFVGKGFVTDASDDAPAVVAAGADD